MAQPTLRFATIQEAQTRPAVDCSVSFCIDKEKSDGANIARFPEQVQLSRSWGQWGAGRLKTEALHKNYEVFLTVTHRAPPPVSFPQDKAVVSKTRSYLNSGF
jgi:hypothetical protein